MSKNSLLDKIGKISESENDQSSLEKTKENNKIFDEQSKGVKNKHKHRVFIVSLYVLWIVAILIVVIRVVHFILPSCMHWLNESQVQSLDKLLFSGAVGTMLGKYGSKLVE